MNILERGARISRTRILSLRSEAVKKSTTGVILGSGSDEKVSVKIGPGVILSGAKDLVRGC